jgi:hypothetical protein
MNWRERFEGAETRIKEMTKDYKFTNEEIYIILSVLREEIMRNYFGDNTKMVVSE